MKNNDFDWQINEFMIYCRSTQLRVRTMYSYKQTLQLFERWWADKAAEKVSDIVVRTHSKSQSFGGTIFSFLQCFTANRKK